MFSARYSSKNHPIQPCTRTRFITGDGMHLCMKPMLRVWRAGGEGNKNETVLQLVTRSLGARQTFVVKIYRKTFKRKIRNKNNNNNRKVFRIES